MEALYTIAAVLFLTFLATEVVAGVILYRRRHEFSARIRSFIGVNYLQSQIANHDRLAQDNFARLERKINYIGRHTKFERELAKKMGVLVEDTSSNLSNQERINDDRVIPLRR